MSKSSNSLKRERTAFEWGLVGVSLAAILAIVAGLIIASLSYKPGPADLSVVVHSDAGRQNRFVLTVTNRGGTTAEELRVEVKRGTESVEVEFRAVPKGDKEEALVEIAGSAPPTAHVRSYEEP